MKSIYSSIMTTKNGSQIPVFHSGRTAESKYNPQLEAQRIVDGIEKKFDFFILIGVSSGILLKNLVQNFNNSVFFCIEPSENDYSFLFSSENNLEIRKFMNHKNIHFCTFDKIESQLCQIYLPVKFNDFKIIETRGWSNENKKIIPKIYEKIQNAINLISKTPQIFVSKRFQKVIMTPHPKEAARLLMSSVEDVLADVRLRAEKIAAKYNCVIVLKTHNTAIVSPSGEFYENHTGNNSMAKAGSGDVLTGMISGIAAQGANLFEAAVLGVYLHGMSGEIASKSLTNYSVMAEDLIANIPNAIMQLGV